MTKETFKRYLVSSLITFLSAFGLVILLDIDSITLETLKDGSMSGLIFAGIRAGVKAILELWLKK